MDNIGLSQRGNLAADSPARIDMELYNEAVDDLYHSETNPTGKFPLNVAENKLNWEMLKQKVASVTENHEIPSWVSRYGNPSGVDHFKKQVAWYLGELLFHCEIAPEHLAFSSGLTSVIEQTAFLLGNPGDVAVIPAPAYPVYTSDLGVKAEVERYDLITHTDLEQIREGLPLSIEQLEAAKKTIESKGKQFKMLILTTPDNPTGGIYSQSQLKAFANWCMANEIHLIVNEIYGLSRIDLTDPDLAADYDEPIPYVSFGALMQQQQSPYLHLWYSFSKDFGISGFRVGLLHSYNEPLMQAYTNINLTHAVSNYTQWILEKVLEDRDFVRQYIQTNQQLLTKSYAVVAKALKSIHIPFNPSRGSLFIWMDLSELLEVRTKETEHQLWLDIFQETGILLTPPKGFGHGQPGWFRMVVTYYQADDMQVVMDRLGTFIEKRRKK